MTARRAHVRGAPADGHGVLLRRDRVDAGRRGRAPAALARCSRSSSPIPSSRRSTLNGRLANGSQPWPIKGRIGQGKGEKSDFWSAVGGQYKVSLDYVVRLSVESGAKLERGPEVRTQTVRTRLVGRPGAHGARDAPLGRARHATRRASRSRDVWVTLPDVGTWTSSDADGRFRFDRLPPGTPPAAGAHRRRPRGRRAARSPRSRRRPGDRRQGMTERVGTDCPNGCLAASGRRDRRTGRLGHGQ